MKANYPPAPWRFMGTLWAGYVRSRCLPEPHDGITPILPGWRAVTLIEYREGTLRYNELMIGYLARIGVRVGVFVEWMWVDDEQSLQGGRTIWGLPKQRAVFTPSAQGIHVADDDGVIAQFDVRRRGRPLPPLPITLGGIGRVGANWAYVPIGLWMCAQPVSVIAREWSSRFPLTAAPLRCCVAATPFRAVLPTPILIPH